MSKYLSKLFLSQIAIALLFLILPSVGVAGLGLYDAQTTGGGGGSGVSGYDLSLGSIISRLQDSVINKLVAVVMTLAVLTFFWGIVKYISSAGDPEKAKRGASIMFWGVIAIFVMVSLWGIVTFLSNSLFGGSVPSGPPEVPRF